jgi:signal transduction histidine kinase
MSALPNVIPDDDVAYQDERGYLATLLQLSQTLNSTLDVAQVLHTAIEQVVDFVSAERGFILLVDPATFRVWGKATQHIDPLDLESYLAGRDKTNKAEVSRTIIDECLRERHTVMSLNAQDDPRYNKHTSVKISQVRSVLCVPLTAQGQTLGIVYVDNRVRTGIFTDLHAEMLQAFANQAGVAIQNARLYENLRKSMDQQLSLKEEIQDKETQRLALEEANKLKSDFIGFVSHELRNPLTTIRGYVQTLSADTDDSLGQEVQAEFYETIEAECDRMLDMINELLDTSRMEAGRPITLALKEVNLSALLHRVARSQKFYKFWTPAHSLDLQVPEGLPHLIADEDKLHQILSNLLSNSIKYSPDGGTICLSAQPANGGVEVVVSDEGLGMTQEQIGKLFSMYERLEREDIKSISGTGLGLHLTKTLVETHGGKINVESEPGKGSRFHVWLPLSPPEHT